MNCMKNPRMRCKMTDNYVCENPNDESGIKCNSCAYYYTFENGESPCDTCSYVRDDEKE